MPKPLEGQVALVTGATRGAGRGAAVELGAAGAIVYCTGRTTRQRRSPLNRPETIEETAELVTAAGGRGIAVQVDHQDIAQVRDLVQRIEREHAGRIRSEEMLENHGVTEDNWQDWYWNHPVDERRGWLTSESRRFTGRVIVALASDPEVAQWNGQTKYASDLAAHYGVKDLDGNTPGKGIWSVEYVRDQELSRADYQSAAH